MYRILIINFIILFVFNMANPMIPQMLIDKQSPEFLNGFLFATMNLSQFIFSPIVLIFYKWIKPKFFIITGPFIYGVSQIGFAYFSDPYVMLLFRFMGGIAVAAVMVSLLVYVHGVEWNDNKQNRYSLFFASNALGGIFGLLFAIYVSKYGIYYNFYLQAVIGFVYILVLYLIIKNIKEPEVKNKTNSIKENFLVLFTSKKVFNVYLLMALLLMAFTVFNSNIGYFATDVYKITSSQVSMITIAILSLGFISNMFLVNIFKKYDVKKLLTTLCIILLASLIALLLNNSIVMIILFFIVFVLGLNIVRPILTSYLVQDMQTAEASKYLSATNLISSLSSILAGYITGIVYQFNSLNMFYLIIILICFSLILLTTGGRHAKV